jgi:hypothetical protein
MAAHRPAQLTTRLPCSSAQEQSGMALLKQAQVRPLPAHSGNQPHEPSEASQ